MLLTITIRGVSPLLTHNGAEGLDTFSPLAREIEEITKRRPRTATDEAKLRELECQRGLYVDAEGRPTFPAEGIRTVIEAAARKSKEGPSVREGIVILSVDAFGYDEAALGSTAAEVGKSAQFTTGVVVQRARVLRTRPKFDDWSIRFTLEADDELVDEARLRSWLELAGRRIGLGDWRPQKSGPYGRFAIESITAS